MPDFSINLPSRRSVLLSLLLVATAALSLTALVLPMLVPASSPPLKVGQVAQQDILAPQAITYQSQVLTEQNRQAAAEAVPNTFTSPDTSVARQQLEHLRNAVGYITSVRSSEYDTLEQKLSDIAALEHIHISQETAGKILEVNESQWQTIQQEAIVVLEQVMRNTIREDRLDQARLSVAARVSLSLSEEQSAIVSELVTALVTPNSFYSEDLTEAARQKARESVEPVTRSYKYGETVVQRGKVLTETDLEALQELKLIQPQYDWKDLTSASIFVLLAVTIFFFYLRHNPKLTQDGRSLLLNAFLLLAFLFGIRAIIPNHTVIPYLLPVPAYGMIVAILIGAEPAIISSVVLSILAASGMPNSLELTIYFTLGSIFGVLTLGRARRMTAFLWAGAAVAFFSTLTIIAFRILLETTDFIGLATLVGAAITNGVASASLTVILQFFLAQFLGMTTALQLMEVSRPDHPLLQLLLRNAPGTYQHSLQVANLAEQAAERVGADTLLTRVGALYHDVGKALNPFFYIENLATGTPNPHDDLEPLSSSQIIHRHISDGLELAGQHRLPGRVRDFIVEHHGTMITRYQYAQAVKAARGDKNQVDKEQFRYPGPRPGSRETAILMLADGCEARVRAEKPQSEESMRKVIDEEINQRVSLNQLDGTNLTLRDLDFLAESFTTTLRGIYHPRIKYPALTEDVALGTDKTPTLSSGSNPLADSLTQNEKVSSTSEEQE